MLWFWVLATPAVVLALLSLRGERRRARFYTASLAEAPDAEFPPATVIVPVKGPEEGLSEHLKSLSAQDYPDYELIVVARTAHDIPPGVIPPGARVVLAGQGSEAMSEKIQNLSAAIASARSVSTVLAFADSDGRVRRTWLRALIAPLSGKGVGASTGYRWYAPDPPDFWSLLRSVWNAVIAGRLGPGANGFAWGGAMAVRREVFDGCRVPDFWRRSASDDYSLSEAVRTAGLEIRFAPGAMVASGGHTGAREFFAWTRRQMVITRVYYPRLWALALAAHLLYCSAMVACIAAMAGGEIAGGIALVLIWCPGMWKGANRARLARAALPECGPWFRRHGWVHTWWVPLGTWAWLCSLLASASSNVIDWRGYRYRLSRGGIEIVRAPASRSSELYEEHGERKHARS